MKKLKVLLGALLIAALAFAPTTSFGLGGEGISKGIDGGRGTAIYGEMTIHGNSSAIVINTVSAEHGLVQYAVQDIAGVTFVAGVSGTVASIADAGDDMTVTTSAPHGLSVGDGVAMNGFTDGNYNAVFLVLTVPTTTTYTVTATFTLTGAGSFQRSDCFMIDRTGVYRFEYHISGDSAANNKIFEWHIYKNATKLEHASSRRKHAVGGDVGTVGSGSVDTLVVGDAIGLYISGLTDATNYVIVHSNFSVEFLGD